MCWRALPASREEVEQTARDVVQTVLAERQRRLDAPLLHGVRNGGVVSTTQTAAPLSFRLAEAKIVGVEWASPAGSRLRLLTDDGEAIEMKTRARTRARVNVVDVDDPKPKRRRKPATVKVRPGSRRRAGGGLDPTLGLEELLGEVVWLPGSGGAWYTVVERDPAGNAIGCGRLSGEDRNETMATQVDGLLVLEERNEELCYRYLVLAVDMSGTRPVRYAPDFGFPAGTAERDDMVVVDRFILEGWVEHIAWWSDDRIARKVLPAQVLFHRWQEHDVGLWLAIRGGRIEYEDDDLLLNIMAVMSSNDRHRTVRRLQSGALRKGPLAGNGHLNTTPYGFVRDETNRPRENAQVWKWILRTFELADVGLEAGGIGCSAPEIARQLASEGFEIDHDRVRTILEDPIYATGEWSVQLSGIRIPQTPIALRNPVPLDRFQRVQDWLALRNGGSENTALGDFLFNYVDCVHEQCNDERGGVLDRPIRLRGYNLVHIKDKTPKLRHNPVTPQCCKGLGRGKGRSWSWKRDLVEPPVVAELRKLATHPEILHQLTLAAAHEIATTSTRLGAEEREALENQIAALVQQREAATDTWVEAAQPGEQRDFADFRRLDESFTKKIAALTRRLENDRAMAIADSAAPESSRTHDDRREAFLEILSIETPTDPRMKALRARLFSLIVSRLIIDDDGKGPITITIESVLLPPGSSAEVANPLFAAGDFLDRYTREKRGLKDKADRLLERALAVKTDFESSHSKSVSTILADLAHLPDGKQLRALRRQSLANLSWNTGGRKPSYGTPAWQLNVTVTADEVVSSIGLTSAEHLVLETIPQGEIVSRSTLEVARKQADLSGGAVSFARESLERRGWIRSAVAGGINGAVRIWCLTDEFAGGGPLNPNDDARGIPRVAQDPDGDAGAVPDRIARSRAKHARRREQAIKRAREGSHSVTALRELTGRTVAQLVGTVERCGMVAVVMPDGEVRFPCWQFHKSGTPRPELREIISWASAAHLSGWAVHLLMTKASRNGHGPTLAAQLSEADEDGLTLSEVLHSIAAAIQRKGQEADRRMRLIRASAEAACSPTAFCGHRSTATGSRLRIPS